MSPLAELASAVLERDNILKYRQLINHPLLGSAWNTSLSNNFGRLVQGIGGRVKGADTILFINKEDVSKDRVMDVTYAQFVCNIRPEKEEKNRTRFVAGGNNGAVYKADNWELVGKTAGLPEHKSSSMKWNNKEELKELFVKPTGENKKLIFYKEL